MDTDEKKNPAATWECPNPKEKYNLWDLVKLLESDRTFAQFFFNLVKRANENDRDAIACVDSYFEPTREELQELGIPASQIDSMRRCTDSGSLVLVVARESSRG